MNEIGEWTDYTGFVNTDMSDRAHSFIKTAISPSDGGNSDPAILIPAFVSRFLGDLVQAIGFPCDNSLLVVQSETVMPKLSLSRVDSAFGQPSCALRGEDHRDIRRAWCCGQAQ
ncbi:MAG: hypothetical protein EBS72_02765 [Rhizobiales bacterium]|nr:hypothetical protein [Hyphomicrobiales bacterium]